MIETRPQVETPVRVRASAYAELAGGVTLVAVAWALSWFGPLQIGAYTFFPLWLGYIITIDATVELRSGCSLLRRSPRAFVLLFAISAPLWWLFELANIRLENWRYLQPYSYSWIGQHALSSIAFSTVLPAMFVTTELVCTSRIGARAINGPVITLAGKRFWTFSAAGLTMIAGALLIPGLLFPLIWIGGWLLIDPINAHAGRPSLLRSLETGNWSRVLILAVSGLICGFFWEMWNIEAMPKWEYDIPYFGFAHLFEMPILGYGGYIPFAFELYAAYHLVTAVLPDHWIARLAINQRGTVSRENEPG